METHQMKRATKQTVKKAARHPWVEAVMRLGYAVRGIVYGLVGLLAIQVAIGGSSGRFTDRQGAIATLAGQPLGTFLLALVVIGLGGYAIWGFIRAILDPFNKGNDLKGWVARAGYLISGVSYAALMFPTLRLLLNRPGGAASGGDASQQQQAVRSILAYSWGPWLVGAIGLGIIGAAISQIVQGWRADFEMRFDSYQLDARQRRWATRLGRFGYIARGIVFTLVGLFLVLAAYNHNAAQVRGVDGALLKLSQQPYGPVLLGIVAAGLIAFGAYSLLGSIWFRFKTGKKSNQIDTR